MTAELRDLVVHLTGGAGDEQRLAYADAICCAFGAHLTGVYTNIAPMHVVTGYAGMGTGALMADYHDANRTAGNDAEENLRKAMERLTASNEFRRYDSYLGEAAEVLCGEARTSGLTLMTRPYQTEEGMPDLAEALIFGSGKGVLFAPPGAAGAVAQPETVVVAWRNSREAARAVVEAMPFLHTARQVIIATVDESGAQAQFGGEPGAEIARHLDRYGIQVELKHITEWSSVHEALDAQINAAGAGMLVMGSYGHSRLRQWVLGGVTRDVLSNATVPVLTAH